jgi:hypothetical protein
VAAGIDPTGTADEEPFVDTSTDTGAESRVDTAVEGVVEGGQRRIDRVLEAGYVADLAELPLAELRSRRQQADQEETDLSYLRRLLQARLDLVGAELDRRASGAAVPADTADMVAFLSRVLSDGDRAAPRGSGHVSQLEPSRAGESRRYVEQLVSDELLTTLTETPDAALSEARAVLARGETTVSAQRHAVQTALDALTAEVGRRYRDGEASIDALLEPGA